MKKILKKMSVAVCLAAAMLFCLEGLSSKVYAAEIGQQYVMAMQLLQQQQMMAVESLYHVM